MLRPMLLLVLLTACTTNGSPSALADAATDSAADTAEDAAAGDEPSRDATDGSGASADVADARGDAEAEPVRVRVATFNASLYRDRAGGLVADLAAGDEQARAVASVLQHIRPDIVLVNEFDYDADGEAARRFVDDYLAVAQGDREPIDYPFVYVPETNTGEASGLDLNQDGVATTTPGSQAYGEDAWGFGRFPGQYGMLVLSRYPIDETSVRSFRLLRWSEMPEALLPASWYGDEAAEAIRLSSKNHVDVPIAIGDTTLHLLGSHPTPPSFDGPEDRNGRRNHDEIRFWSDYLTEANSTWIRDDGGTTGGLATDASFVIVGDLNSDPFDGGSRHEAIVALLGHERVRDPQPTSEGAVEAAERDGRANTAHTGDPALDTADFSDNAVGNLRVDYCLPSADLEVVASGVFWPASDDPDAALADVSDHHLVWVDLRID